YEVLGPPCVAHRPLVARDAFFLPLPAEVPTYCLSCRSIGSDDHQNALGIVPLAVKGAAVRELSEPVADEILRGRGAETVSVGPHDDRSDRDTGDKQKLLMIDGPDARSREGVPEGSELIRYRIPFPIALPELQRLIECQGAPHIAAQRLDALLHILDVLTVDLAVAQPVFPRHQIALPEFLPAR